MEKGNRVNHWIQEWRLKGWICEQFAYLPNLVVYPNTSDINELSEMATRLERE